MSQHPSLTQQHGLVAMQSAMPHESTPARWHMCRWSVSMLLVPVDSRHMLTCSRVLLSARVTMQVHQHLCWQA